MGSLIFYLQLAVANIVVLVIFLMTRILHPVDPVRKSLMAYSPYQDIYKKRR